MLYYQNDKLVLDLPEFGKPFFVTFKKSRYQDKNQLIYKAVGFHKIEHQTKLKICDLTAGLGQDAYVLYQSGKCDLQLVERSPLIAQLLQDGLKRADWAINLYIGEARDYLKRLIQNKDFPDVIYFDPIFPEKNKSALSQKSARILRNIVGNDLDASTVFEIALQVAKKRVVVKRALHSPFITTQKPDVIYKGKSIRFDVYLKK